MNSDLLYFFLYSVFGSMEQSSVRELLVLCRCQEKEAERVRRPEVLGGYTGHPGTRGLVIRGWLCHCTHFCQLQGSCLEPPTPLSTLPWPLPHLGQNRADEVSGLFLALGGGCSMGGTADVSEPRPLGPPTPSVPSQSPLYSPLPLSLPPSQCLSSLFF